MSNYNVLKNTHFNSKLILNNEQKVFLIFYFKIISIFYIKNLFFICCRMGSRRSTNGGTGYQDLDGTTVTESPITPDDLIIGQDIEMTSVSVVPDGKK